MNFDRKTFLSLATALAAAACGSSAAEGDASEGALEQEGEQCVEARKVSAAYPVTEGCFIAGLEGEPLSYCISWSNHFEAGVAHRALANLEGRTSWTDLYDAGRKALQQTCKRSAEEEATLERFCASITDHESDYEECRTYARGVKAESRPLIKTCVKNTHYDVYSCIEGMGWDGSPEQCIAPEEVGGGLGYGCDDLPGGKETCKRVTSVLRPHIANTSIGCMISEGSASQEAQVPIDHDAVATSCALATVARTCLDVTTASAPCEALVGELRGIDPQLGAKDHLNAGGRFTKQCRAIFSGLNTLGKKAISTCIVAQARAAGDGLKIRQEVSISKCLQTASAPEN